MIAKQRYNAVCRGCKQSIDIYEYHGLEGGLYGSHHCPEISQLFIDRPRIRKTFEKLTKVATTQKR